MSESTRDQRMSPQLAPVAFVDLTVPRATEGGKSAKEGKAMEDKGKGKAEEGQDTKPRGLRTTDLQGSASRVAPRAERPRDHQPRDVRVHA